MPIYLFTMAGIRIQHGPTRLAGVWQAEFRRDTDSAFVVVGQIALFPSPRLRSHYQISDPNALEGAFDVDFRQWGFDLQRPAEPSQAMAHPTANDSIEIILNPRVGSGSVILIGTLQRETVLGNWYRESPRGPKGSFRLSRY
jgi:hypothetical protein